MNRFAAWILVAAMAVGSATMWVVSPVAWLWIASQAQRSSEPSLGPYALVLIGVVGTTIALGFALGRLNRRHAELTGRDPNRRARLAWHRSMRDDRAAGAPGTVLDVVMISSVAVALCVGAVWFFLFAGSSLPQ